MKQAISEFAKSHANRAYVPKWYTCHCACMLTWFTYHRARLQCGLRANLSPCQRAIRRANASTWRLACQRTKRGSNISTWQANLPKSVPIFQTLLLRNATGNSYTLLLKKNYITLDIIVVHIICIAVSYIKIVLDFISVPHVILKKSVKNFSFFVLKVRRRYGQT